MIDRYTVWLVLFFSSFKKPTKTTTKLLRRSLFLYSLEKLKTTTSLCLLLPSLTLYILHEEKNQCCRLLKYSTAIRQPLHYYTANTAPTTTILQHCFSLHCYTPTAVILQHCFLLLLVLQILQHCFLLLLRLSSYNTVFYYYKFYNTTAANKYYYRIESFFPNESESCFPLVSIQVLYFPSSRTFFYRF